MIRAISTSTIESTRIRFVTSVTTMGTIDWIGDEDQGEADDPDTGPPNSGHENDELKPERYRSTWRWRPHVDRDAALKTISRRPARAGAGPSSRFGLIVIGRSAARVSVSPRRGRWSIGYRRLRFLAARFWGRSS